MKKRITVFLSTVNCFFTIYAQGEIDLQPKVFYRNEWSLALMLNSNGWGINYRYGEHLNAADKRLFEVDFAYMKDPKERKSYSNVYDASGSRARYVEGKKNLAFDFRFGYGKQHEMFRKHDAGGVAIRYFYNFGPSIVLLKPIYYNAGEKFTVGQQTFIDPFPKPEKYDAEWIDKNILIISRASFFKGFDNMRVVPGAYAKFGFNFEFGRQDRIIHALEAGLIGEGFIKKVEIMDFSYPPTGQSKIAKNQQVFLTIFISYRFGRIVDPYEVKKKRERSREISY